MLISISEKGKTQGTYACKHIEFCYSGSCPSSCLSACNKVLASILNFQLAIMDMVSFSSTCAGQMSAFHFPCQHTRGRASAAIRDACTSF
jgi:hypothetical protein